VDVQSLGYRTDLMVRRLAGSEIVDRGDYVVVRTPGNPTFYWGNFVLFADVGRAARKLVAVFDRELPDSGHVAIGLDTRDGAVGDPAAWRELGLLIEPCTVLTAERLDEPARPKPAAECRVLDGDDDWEQAAQLRLALAVEERQRSATHEAFLRRSLAEARALADAGHGWRLGAFVNGRLCAGLGIVMGDRGTARYQQVETHPQWRRQGLAAALVHEAGLLALRAGAATLVIAADPDGGAIRVYRSLGFVERERQARLWRGLSEPDR